MAYGQVFKKVMKSSNAAHKNQSYLLLLGCFPDKLFVLFCK